MMDALFASLPDRTRHCCVNYMTLGLVVLVLLFFSLWPPQVAAATFPSLTRVPTGERWFSVTMNGEQVGFARQQIIPTSTGYRLESDGSVKMLVLGFTREASAHETYLVGKDLALQS